MLGGQSEQRRKVEQRNIKENYQNFFEGRFKELPPDLKAALVLRLIVEVRLDIGNLPESLNLKLEKWKNIIETIRTFSYKPQSEEGQDDTVWEFFKKNNINSVDITNFIRGKTKILREGSSIRLQLNEVDYDSLYNSVSRILETAGISTTGSDFIDQILEFLGVKREGNSYCLIIEPIKGVEERLEEFPETLRKEGEGRIKIISDLQQRIEKFLTKGEQTTESEQSSASSPPPPSPPGPPEPPEGPGGAEQPEQPELEPSLKQFLEQFREFTDQVIRIENLWRRITPENWQSFIQNNPSGASYAYAVYEMWVQLSNYIYRDLLEQINRFMLENQEIIQRILRGEQVEENQNFRQGLINFRDTMTKIGRELNSMEENISFLIRQIEQNQQLREEERKKRESEMRRRSERIIRSGRTILELLAGAGLVAGIFVAPWIGAFAILPYGLIAWAWKQIEEQLSKGKK